MLEYIIVFCSTYLIIRFILYILLLFKMRKSVSLAEEIKEKTDDPAIHLYLNRLVDNNLLHLTSKEVKELNKFLKSEVERLCRNS